MRRATRPGYTLIEVLVALAIGAFILLALYYAINTHLSLTAAGRQAISSSTLTRSVFTRLSLDISATITVVDPNRYKELADAADAAASGMSGMGGTGDMGAMDVPDDAPPPLFPLGVQGDAKTLHLFVSKVPVEVYGRAGKPGAMITSDLRRISYWLSGTHGLCRTEIKLITAPNAIDLSLPTDDEQQWQLAPEVKDIQFRYFDGQTSQWMEKWDSSEYASELNPIPVGPPRAIEVRIGVLPPGQPEGGDLKYYRQVIAVPSASGKMEEDQPEDGM